MTGTSLCHRLNFRTEPTGEVSERLKEQHWKCCIGLKPDRGFESRPLRYFLSCAPYDELVGDVPIAALARLVYLSVVRRRTCRACSFSCSAGQGTLPILVLVLRRVRFGMARG